MFAFAVLSFGVSSPTRLVQSLGALRRRFAEENLDVLRVLRYESHGIDAGPASGSDPDVRRLRDMQGNNPRSFAGPDQFGRMVMRHV